MKIDRELERRAYELYYYIDKYVNGRKVDECEVKNAMLNLIMYLIWH